MRSDTSRGHGQWTEATPRGQRPKPEAQCCGQDLEATGRGAKIKGPQPRLDKAGIAARGQGLDTHNFQEKTAIQDLITG